MHIARLQSQSPASFGCGASPPPLGSARPSRQAASPPPAQLGEQLISCPIRLLLFLSVSLDDNKTIEAGNMNTTTFVNLAADPAAAAADAVFPTLQVMGATVCAGLATVLVWGWPRKVSTSDEQVPLQSY